MVVVLLMYMIGTNANAAEARKTFLNFHVFKVSAKNKIPIVLKMAVSRFNRHA